MSQPVHALNLFNVSSNAEYLAFETAERRTSIRDKSSLADVDLQRRVVSYSHERNFLGSHELLSFCSAIHSA
jgi:hypothetical protein